MKRKATLIERLQLVEATGIDVDGREIYLEDGQVFSYQAGGYLQDGETLLRLGDVEKKLDPAKNRWVTIS